MPIFEFECEYCKNITERFTSDANQTYADCRFCGRRAKKIISAPNFVLEGTCWSRDNYDRTPIKDRDNKWSNHHRKLNGQPQA